MFHAERLSFDMARNQAQVLNVSTPDSFTVELNFEDGFSYFQTGMEEYQKVNPRLINQWL